MQRVALAQEAAVRKLETVPGLGLRTADHLWPLVSSARVWVTDPLYSEPTATQFF
jgi:hypothetical protein